MPGVFTHFLTVDEIARQLGQPWARAGQDYPMHVAFGSIGPDYLYFYKNDWGPLGQVGHLFFSVFDDLREIVNLYNSVVTAQENVTDWLSGGLQSALQANVALLESTVVARLVALATSSHDLFEAFSPPISRRPEGAAIKEWWWADIAHQHRSFDFARQIWATSNNDSSLRAYVLGYLTHLATDVVGHPLINLYSGGPYRNHWRRHNIIERILDSHLWQSSTGEELTESGAYRRIHFPGYDPSTPVIPEKLCAFLADAYKVVYQDLAIASGIPDANDVREMFKIYYKYLKGATDNTLLNRPKPPEDFDWFDLDEWIRVRFEDVMSRQPNLGKLPYINPNDPRSWLAFLVSLMQYLVWLAEVAVMIATIPVAAGMRLATAPARYLLWKLSLTLYELYDTSRLVLVTSGFVHPTYAQVEQCFPHIVRIGDQDAFRSKNTSYVHVTNSEQTYHLVHPSDLGADLEKPSERIIQNVSSTRFQSLLLSRFSNVDRSFLINACHSVETSPQFGAIDLADFLVNEFQSNGGREIPNLNLDGDRGFGWTDWITDDPLPWSENTSFIRCPKI
ncbi:hypothetical protein AWB76_05253 [Caballeronia temeraria]|uniref:Phospholipase C/D domain-containing protein n=1 Tax=Caballeronia temeraria TaxID=1777137 RepID=A0A158C8U7_9BURK|nr:zinc dependent phospholipase C family protein [Caballeronia temeraria]SAK78785.1 hypothetical protein AWB76_05253 [Caballeronia temeraria]